MEIHRDSEPKSERPLFKAAQDLAREISELEPNPEYATNAPCALIVGGYVRDSLLGLNPKDADIEVYGVAPDELKALLKKKFGQVEIVGEAFAVLKVSLGDGLELDVSIPRRESKTGKGHKDFAVIADPSMTIQEAAQRRDFTVNALAMDPVTGVIFDPFGGQEDIKNRILRVTDSERFQDDPLRVLRAMQFVARLEFTIDLESAQLMQEMVSRGELDHLPRERVTTELEKLLVKAKRPSVGFEFGRTIGVIERHFPELHALIDVPQEPEWHPEGDVWIHTMMVVDAAAKIARRDGFSESDRRPIVLGALAHDFGKPATTETIDGRIRSLGHEEAGEAPTREMCKRLSFGGDDVEAVVAIAKMHLQPGMLYRALETGKITDKAYVNAVRKVVKRLGKTSWRILLAASEADFRGRTIPGVDTAPYTPGLTFAKTVIDHGLDKEALKPLMQGRDLITEFGLVPSKTNGPLFGRIISAVEAARDEGKIETREQAIELARNMLLVVSKVEL